MVLVVFMVLQSFTDASIEGILIFGGGLGAGLSFYGVKTLS